MDISTGWLPKK